VALANLRYINALNNNNNNNNDLPQAPALSSKREQRRVESRRTTLNADSTHGGAARRSARYAVRFMPKENGVYFVHIKFNEAHIPGSPLPILIGKLGADPALVFARGDGLDKGESGASFAQSHI